MLHSLVSTAGASSSPILDGARLRIAITRVTDGARTRDLRDHNPALYQLSYGHQGGTSVAHSEVNPNGGSSLPIRPL